MRKVLFFIFLSALVWGNEVEIKVTLNPAGSFTAKSSEVLVEGSLQVSNSQLKASRIVLPISSLETGLSLRDSHMKTNYFEVAQHPKAVLLEAVGAGGRFTGKLEVHGVQKEIRGKYRIKQGVFETKFSCRLSDFKIKEANYMGVGVEDEVTVSTKIRIPE
ncbi:YceI family protein [bacterium]|nr:YceI family protein [bacterium]